MSRFFLLKTMTFAAIFCIVYCFSIWIIGQNFQPSFGTQFYYPEGGAGHSQLRLKEACQSKEVDLLIIGSSHAYRNYDPRFFSSQHLNTFNLGSTAQTPVQTLELLKQFGPTMRPKFLFIDFFLPLFYMDGMESSIDLLANNENASAKYSQYQEIKWWNALLYRDLNRNLFNNPPRNCPQKIGNDLYVSNGYVESSQVFNPHHQIPVVKGEIKKEQIEAFRTIIEWANAKKIRYAIVQSPLYNKQSSPNYHQLPTEIKSIFPISKFIEGQDAFTKTEGFFMDGDHLNPSGVAVFNQWLYSKMKRDSFFN